MKKEEVRFEGFLTDGAKLIVVAFGSMARVSKTSVELAREEGMKVGTPPTDHALSLSGKGSL